MRKVVNPKIKEFCIKHSDLTIDELLPLVNKKFFRNYTRLELQKYLYRNKIPYKYANPKKSHNMSNLPIGTEYTKGDGMVLIKVAKNEWKYKQRYIYEQTHNVKLKDDEYIIFLDNNRTNFNPNNLQAVSRKTASYLVNNKLKSSIPQVTKLGIDVAELMIKVNNKGESYEKNELLL